VAVIVRQECIHDRTFDHAVLRLPDDRDLHEPLYVDADGVATAYDLLERWRTRERLVEPVLDDPANTVRFVGHLENESWSRWLAKKLEARFGKLAGLNLVLGLGLHRSIE